MQTSSQWRQQEETFENQFFIYGPKCNKIHILGYLGGPEGVFNNQTTSILLCGYPLTIAHPFLCTCQIRKQSDKKFLSLNPTYEKYILFSYLGGPGVNFRSVRPHHKAVICITREQNNHQFFIYGPQYKKMCIFGYSGALGGP